VAPPLPNALQSALKARTEKNRPAIRHYFSNGWIAAPWERGFGRDRGLRSKKPVTRAFFLRIGSDVNTQLLDQIAEGTRAFSQYVLANEDLEVKVSSFYTGSKTGPDECAVRIR